MSKLSPSPGYETIEQEFEDRLREAFVTHGADYIVIESRRQRFQIESALWAEAQGWLDQGDGIIQLDEQSSEIRFRLTPAGRTHFGLAVPNAAAAPRRAHEE